MIFGKHNFTHNFLNAIGYQDEFMADQIIIDEVARLIVEEKKNVVEALRKVGVNATYRDNNDLIKSMLIKEIEDSNPTIVKFLSEKIVQNQIDENKVKEIAALAAKGKTTKKADGSVDEQAYIGKNTFSQNLSTILNNETVKDSLSTLIAGGIKKVFSKSNTDKTTNDQLLSERLKINEMQAAAAAKTSKKKILILVLVSAGVLIVGGVVYFMVRRKYDKGGLIDNNPGTPSVSTTSTPPEGAV
jgi:uncharacterized membrane protein YheB (UPF0754 family)